MNPAQKALNRHIMLENYRNLLLLATSLEDIQSLMPKTDSKNSLLKIVPVGWRYVHWHYLSLECSTNPYCKFQGLQAINLNRIISYKTWDFSFHEKKGLEGTQTHGDENWKAHSLCIFSSSMAVSSSVLTLGFLYTEQIRDQNFGWLVLLSL